MSFGISNNVRCREVRECTPELFWKAVRSPLVSDVCAQIADGLEKVRRGEMVKEDYETLKAGLKKRLPIFTPHATFKNGRRLNADAVPSGLSMYDIDHLPNPREYWVEKSQELSVKNVLRFVVLTHVTPSTEGLRLFFIIPDGMDLVQAQKWMSEQLGDENYDSSVKDLARSSFVVPEDYVLYIDEDKLFAEKLTLPICHSERSEESREHPLDAHEILRSAQNDNSGANNCRGVSHTPECVHDDGKDNCQLSIVNCQLNFKGVPYSEIIARWFALAGGEPVQGERNDKLHRLGGISRIMMRIFFYRLCLGTDFRRRK